MNHNHWINVKEAFLLLFFRLAAKGLIPAGWFEPDLPPEKDRKARAGRLHLEIVSHCWHYSHFLAYQLSSLVIFPPKNIDVTMTVFYCPADTDTSRLLDHFGKIEVPGVTWKWWGLPRRELFRRGIGRNLAALKTTADWVWFTDCDTMFREACLDTLASLLQNRREALVFPDEERCTKLLAPADPMLRAGYGKPRILDIDPDAFVGHHPRKATGPLQITHGDVCRAIGYCRAIRLYQTPSDTWCKAHEDRAFRWLLRSQGMPLRIPGVYRIKHVDKGRYTGSAGINHLRIFLRKLQAKVRGY